MLKNPYVLAGAAVFMLIGAYLFGVDDVVELFKALFSSIAPEIVIPT